MMPLRRGRPHHHVSPPTTYRLRAALAIVEAAPSWPIWKLNKELQEKGLSELAGALRFVVLGLRAGRFIASIKSAL